MITSESKHILLELTGETKSLVVDALGVKNTESLVVHEDTTERTEFDVVFTTDSQYKQKGTEEVILIADYFEDSQFSIIPEKLLSYDFVKVAVKRAVGLEGSLNIENTISNEDYRSLKITDPLSIGYYLDISTNEAYRVKSDHISVARSFTAITSLFFEDFKALPIEVDLICNDDIFILQFHAVAKFNQDIIKKASSCLKSLDVTFSDLYTLSMTSETVMTVVWQKDEQTRGHLIHGRESFSEAGPSSDLYKKVNRIIDPNLVKEEYREENSDVLDEKLSSLSIIKKITDFLKIREDEDENFVFDSSLQSYPNQEIVKVLNSEDIEFIKKIVGDNRAHRALTDTISGHRDSLSKNKEIVNLIPGAIEELEVYETISAFDSEDEAITKILGVTDDLTQETTLVKGTSEDEVAATIIEGVTDELKDEVLRIKGSKEELEEIWKTKRKVLSEGIKSEIQNYVIAGEYSQEDLENKVYSLLSEKMGLNDDESKKLGELVFSSASAKSIGNEVNESNSENFFLNLELDKVKGQLSKKDEQILRLRKVMDKMKADFLSRKEADDELKKSMGNAQDTNIEKQLNLAELKIRSLLRDSKIKDGKVKELERKYEHTIKNRNHRIELLEEKISDLVATNSSLYEKVESVAKDTSSDIEIKLLESQLKISNDKVEYLNSQLEQAKSSEDNASETVSIEMFNQVKEDAKKYQEELVALKRDNQQLSQSNEVYEKQENLNDPSKVKELEGQLKASSLEVKKYEQKIKFMNSQMNEMEKKLKRLSRIGSGRGGAGGAAGGDKRAKQLEKNLEKVNSLKAKAEAELAKKREEAHKHKTENSILRNKIAELERKVGKKAA